MAKVVGLIGGTSGKVGNVVYAVSNGVQTARIYQPIVANPKTTAQILQRAKANLVGQLSSMVSKACIVGLGGNARERRSAFLRNALLKATASTSSGRVQAKLQPSDIVFSRGDVEPVVFPGTPTMTTTSLTFNVERRAGVTDEQADSSATQIIVLFADELGRYRSSMSQVVATPATSAPVVFNFVPVTDRFYAYVYLVPISLRGARMSTVMEEIDPSAESIDADVVLNSGLVSLDYGDSIFLRSIEYPTA